jgi:1,4-alpha-glucan branching enzyme
MSNRYILSLVLNGHVPFARHPEIQNPSQELWLFESISETYIPLLEAFDRLDRDLVPFRMAISFSPVLCHMLTDEFLLRRYNEYTDKQIAFGEQELRDTVDDPVLNSLVKLYYDRVTEKKAFFTEKCESNILKKFDHYQKKGRLEILATAATSAFLPFYTGYPEAVQAQFDVAISSYKVNFGRFPQGFWLPELGWKTELDFWLRAYNFGYTIVDSHALAFARPFAEKGSFYPAKTPQGIVVFSRDFYSAEDIAEIVRDPVYRFNFRDQGFELPAEKLIPFLGSRGSRNYTGYRYWASGDDRSGSILYNYEEACRKAVSHARYFLDKRLSRLNKASCLMDEPALSLCAFEADSFGRFWHEGSGFIEALFREGAQNEEVQFMTPSEYLCKLDSSTVQTLTPEFSSWGTNGYSETWLDASNDWMYRHTMRALDRMVELVDRFPNNTGLKERALNQAAREILLVIASDWSKMLYKQECADYARSRIEGSLRNFTTIYEALGSNYISTEWLTQLERRNNIFPNINYRVFRRRQQTVTC